MARISSDTRSTIDAGEVERHSKLMKIWWDREGGIKGLHTFNEIRIPFVVDGLTTAAERSSPAPLADKKILDIGCGGGIVSEALAKLGAKVTGVDPSSDLIELAKEHSNVDKKVAANKPTYYCTTVEEHVKEFPEYYDAVVASEVVDHVANVDMFLENCVAVLKPGGKIFITTPNRTRLTQFLMIFVAENILKIIPKGIHKYENFVTPAEVTSMLEKYRCKVNDTHGIFYFPFIDKYQWVYFQTLWYALVATKAKHD